MSTTALSTIGFAGLGPGAAAAERILTTAVERGYAHRDIAALHDVLGEAGAET
jgi:hypothetical protein